MLSPPEAMPWHQFEMRVGRDQSVRESHARLSQVSHAILVVRMTIVCDDHLGIHDANAAIEANRDELAIHHCKHSG